MCMIQLPLQRQIMVLCILICDNGTAWQEVHSNVCGLYIMGYVEDICLKAGNLKPVLVMINLITM